MLAGWLLEGRKVRFTTDCGWGVKLFRLLSGLPPEEILKADMSKLDKTGLKDHLAPTRANALNSMAAQIKQAAIKMAEHH